MASAATVFTPPQSCSTIYVDQYRFISLGVQCSNGRMVSDKDCSPTSPSACPFNWQPVRTENSMTTCCPKEYSLTTQSGQSAHCYSVARGNVLEAITCAQNRLAIPVTATYTWAPGIWAQEVSYSGMITPLSVTQTATSSSYVSSTTSSNSPSKSTLPPAQIAGIVGSLIGAAILIIFGSIYCLKKRHRKTEVTLEHQSFPHSARSYFDAKAEIDTINTDQGAFDTETELEATNMGQHAFGNSREQLMLDPRSFRDDPA